MNGWGKGGVRKRLDLTIKNSDSSGLVLSDIIKATMRRSLTQATLKEIHNLQVCYGKIVNQSYFYQLIKKQFCFLSSLHHGIVAYLIRTWHKSTGTFKVNILVFEFSSLILSLS